MNPRLALALALASAFALGAVVLVAAARDGGGGAEAPAAQQRFEGSIMPEGVRAPDFRLRDQDGDPISMRQLRGSPVIVTFLYTTCEETCPLQAHTVRGALDELGHEVPAIAISVDPPRDTPASARAFLAEHHATGRLDFALGTREELRPVWRGFAIQPQTVTREHQSRFTLVDARGYQRIGFPAAYATPEALAHDIRMLEREARG